MTTKRSLPLSDEELEEFEASRDLYQELKHAAKEIHAGSGLWLAIIPKLFLLQ
jgi:putative transcriptional regulator